MPGRAEPHPKESGPLLIACALPTRIAGQVHARTPATDDPTLNPGHLMGADPADLNAFLEEFHVRL